MSDNKTILNIKDAITAKLKELRIEHPEVVLDKPSDFKFGDMTTNVAMRYAKELGKKPLEIAETITEALTGAELDGFKEASFVAPGFINISLDTSFFTSLVATILTEGDSFGDNDSLKGQKWVIEHTSPNPNKAMHIGHLRNNLVGMSLVNLLKHNGAEVVSEAIDNNRGIAIAKAMWGFLAHQKKEVSLETSVEAWLENPEGWYTPAEKNMYPDLFVTECYVLGEADLKADPELETKIRDLVVRWEAKDEFVWTLWEHVLSYAYAGMNRTLKRLGSHWDKVWHEHEHYEEGKQYVEVGLKKGIFQKLEDGAVLTDLDEKYGLPDTILLKKDGTALYITQDLALTALKKTQHQADKLIWVIGPDQSLAMKQLFAVCEQLGIGKLEDFTHVSYGYVGLKDKDGEYVKMSSRAGTVVLIDDVIDGVKTKITEHLNESELATDDIDAHAEKLALAAVKFALLKPDRNQSIDFNREDSVRVNGDSGIYVMYTYARTQSILGKYDGEVAVADWSLAELGKEAELLKKLMYFPDTIKHAADDLSVHHVAQALLDIASAYNSWYAKEQVLDGGEREQYKLAVTKATGQVIRNGLSMLGIETVDRI